MGEEEGRRNCIKFAKTNIDDITGLQSNPGIYTVIHKSAELGISILACRPRSAAGRENLRKLEAVRAASVS